MLDKIDTPYFDKIADYIRRRPGSRIRIDTICKAKTREKFLFHVWAYSHCWARCTGLPYASLSSCKHYLIINEIIPTS